MSSSLPFFATILYRFAFGKEVYVTLFLPPRDVNNITRTTPEWKNTDIYSKTLCNGLDFQKALYFWRIGLFPPALISPCSVQGVARFFSKRIFFSEENAF